MELIIPTGLIYAGMKDNRLPKKPKKPEVTS
jgi:hypothetical protein